MSKLERWSVLAGPLAVVLWIAGIVGMTRNSPADHATDDQVLTYYQGHANTVLLSGWLFAIGCLAFVWFAATVRARFAVAERGPNTFSTLFFGGAVATAVFGIATTGGDLAAAINKNDISPAVAGAFHRISDAFFVGAELTSILFVLAAAVLAFRVAALPKWWGAFSVLVAIVLVIGPIGWAGLIFGVPIWTLGTTFFVLRAPSEALVPQTSVA